MKRFQFRLEPMLRVKRFREEEAQVVLAAAQRKLAEEEENKALLQSTLSDLHAHQAELMGNQLDIGKLVADERFGEDLSERIEAASVKIKASHTDVDVCLEEVRRIHADCEALEQLRERRLAEHYQDALGAEQQSIDESAVLRWNRA